MKQCLIKLIKNISGATAIEYGIITSLISLSAIAGVTATGDGVKQTFCNVSYAITTQFIPGCRVTLDADVIKLAMIDAHHFIKQKYPSVKMMLQIHDELLFEVPNDLCDAFEKDIKRIMEQAPQKRAHLSVSPVAEVGRGHNWDEAH